MQTQMKLSAIAQVIASTRMAEITSTVAGDVAVLHRWLSLAQHLHADGVLVGMLVKETEKRANPEADEALRSVVHQAILAGLDKSMPAQSFKVPKPGAKGEELLKRKGARVRWLPSELIALNDANLKAIPNADTESMEGASLRRQRNKVTTTACSYMNKVIGHLMNIQYPDGTGLPAHLAHLVTKKDEPKDKGAASDELPATSYGGAIQRAEAIMAAHVSFKELGSKGIEEVGNALETILVNLRRAKAAADKLVK